MTRAYFFTLCLLCIFLISGCTPQGKPAVTASALHVTPEFSISAEITKIDGPLATLQIDRPKIFPESAKLALQLAQQIVDSSYFLEDRQTTIKSTKVSVLRFSGNILLLKVAGPKVPFTTGETVELYLDRKIVAVKDFEVISGSNKDVAKYIQEDVTSALVSSGQFHVVERQKLDTLLEEIKLSQSGMVDPSSAKKAGKLLGADLILTGTFMPTGEDWNANLRLLDTETGQIISAINMIGSLHELQTEAYRELKTIKGSFENPKDDIDGWQVGDKYGDVRGEDGYQKVFFTTEGCAAQSRRCLSLDYKLGTTVLVQNKPINIKIRNRLQRDVSEYEGISFFIKGSPEITVRFDMADSQADNSAEENWVKDLIITSEWQKISIPFRSLSLHKKKATKKKTNQILDLGRIEKIDWIVSSRSVAKGTVGSIKLDEVTFY